MMPARVFELRSLRACSVRLALLCLLSIAAVSGAVGQTPQPTGTPDVDVDPKKIDVKTDLITLTLTVTDLYGRYVSGLTKQAFTIQDDGKDQEITFFSDSDAPASVGILFDVSGSMSGEKIAKARNALQKFINTSHPSDEYFLIAFNKKAQLLLDRSRDGDAVIQKLTLIQPKHNTALYDAVYLGLERVSRGTHQKKALLIISDGQDNASRYNFGEVKRLMKESDIVTYAVGILGGGDSASQAGLMGQAFLDELTSVTGGRSFYPNGDAELDEIFERIAIELRHQYSIGYTPPNFKPDGKWHKTKVKVKPPRGISRLTVRSREGYYATPFSDLK